MLRSLLPKYFHMKVCFCVRVELGLTHRVLLQNPFHVFQKFVWVSSYECPYSSVRAKS